MNSYDGYSDSYIQKMIENQTKSIEQHQQSIDVLSSNVKEAQAELDRRTLEAYWTAHPDLTRVAVGDKLLVTEEYIDYFRYGMRQQTWVTAGMLVTIETINKGYNASLYIEVNEFVGVIPIELVHGMKSAYLQQHPEATEE